MISILYGEDEFTRSEALSEMEKGMGPSELRDVNITTFNGSEIGFDLLMATCETVPFLSQARMVIVRGLLEMFERGRRKRLGSSSTAQRALGEWEALPERLAVLPLTTQVVFVDGRLRPANRLFASIRGLAQVRTFPLPRWNELQEWVRRRAVMREVEIEARAVQALADIVGPNLRVIDQELQKLALYRWGRTVRYEDVGELVSHARDSNIFRTVDAIIEGRPGVAIQMVHRLLESGEAAVYLIVMLARQARLLLLAKALRVQGALPTLIGQRLSLSGYPLTKTLDQESRLTELQLVSMYGKLLDADRAMKATLVDEGLVLDMLVADLASRRW